jgi:hypothetical protein
VDGVNPKKDDFLVQQERLARLAKKLAPGCEIHFDPDRVPTFVRMRVDDPSTGAILIVSSGDWHVSEIADKSDNDITQLLKSWSGGKL